ncbi:TonB family protein [Pseudoxanthomonas composti]|uniref:Protein TonB n=1 Tax=Pseudoxanthomonas composti TaxID=2137479 RepID=A0A4Q1JU14_9GAMM|nr:TonB family protein [Pseudoxanthomonas composti]RXR01462.1 TonB family protein [Pseudoxanthomonas composti]
MLRELIFLLTETAVASSVAMALVLLLRRPVRAWGGAGAGYALWALVPVALGAVLLPAPVRPLVPLAMTAQVGAAQPLAALPAGPAFDWSLPLGLCWLAGVLVVAALQVWQQRRFLRRLGPLRMHRPGLQVAATSAGLPAVTGVLRPRIVLPADFLQRYDAAERALVVAHERQHIVRGDLLCNALLALLRCLHWFNPLLHLAARHYRHDQELACDARVLRRHPQARRAYAQAMLKTQLDDLALPVGCHWHTHPIKERIAMLKRPIPRRWQRAVSSVLLLALLAGGGYAAWAQQPSAPAVKAPAGAADEAMYGLQIQLDAAGQAHPFEVHARPSEPFGFMTTASQGHAWSGEFTLTEAGNGRLRLQGELKDNDRVVSAPTLVFELGKQASIEVGSDPGALFKMQVMARVLHADERPMPPPADADLTTTVFKGAVRIQTAADGTQHATANAIEITREASQKPLAELKPPAYPEEAARARIEGRVVVLVDVTPDGHVAAATIETSQPAGVFDAAVLKAVRGWTFDPAMQNGTAVVGRVRVPVDFAMDDAPMAGTQAALIDRNAYGWFTEDAGKPLATTLNCDAALLEKQDVSGQTRRRCGIRRPEATPPATAPQAVSPPQAAVARGSRVLADVAADGQVANPRLDTYRSPNALERALVRTLKKSRHAPAVRDGVPVPSTLAIDTRAVQPAPAGFLAAR